MTVKRNGHIDNLENRLEALLQSRNASKKGTRKMNSMDEDISIAFYSIKTFLVKRCQCIENNGLAYTTSKAVKCKERKKLPHIFTQKCDENMNGISTGKNEKIKKTKKSATYV